MRFNQLVTLFGENYLQTADKALHILNAEISKLAHEKAFRLFLDIYILDVLNYSSLGGWAFNMLSDADGRYDPSTENITYMQQNLASKYRLFLQNKQYYIKKLQAPYLKDDETGLDLTF